MATLMPSSSSCPLLLAPRRRSHHSSRSTAADAGPEHVARHGQAVGADKKSQSPIVLDSGASFHVTGVVACLAAFTAAAGDGAMHHARDGRNLPVAGTGTLACQDFHIPGVRHVPALGDGVSLVSVQQLAACGYLIAFGGGACYVKDPSSGSLLGRGRLNEDDGLYHLEFLRIPTGDQTSTGSAA